MDRLTFSILCLEGAVLSFNVAATAAIVPSVAKEFALSQFLVGAAVWLYMIPYGIAALLYGPLIRRFDAKRVELACIACFSLANLLAGCAPSIALFFAGRFLMGVFGASVIPLALILIAHRVGPKDRGTMVGIFFSATFCASLAGLFLSGILAWRLIYLIPGVCGLGLWFVMLRYLPAFPPQKEEAGFRYLRALHEPRVQAAFFYIFAISLVYHGVQQWLAVYFSLRWGLSQFLVSMLVTLTSASGIFGEIAGGILADRQGRLRVMNAGLLAMTACVFLLLFHAPVWGLALIMAAWGIGWTLNHASVSALLTDLPREYLHEAASLNSSVRFVAGGIGVCLAGVLMQRSFSLGFSAAGALLAALFIFSAKLFMRADRKSCTG